MGHSRTAASLGLFIATSAVLAGCEPARVCGAGTVLVAGSCVVADGDSGAPLDASTLELDGGAPDSGPVPLPFDVHEIDGIGAEGTAARYAAIDRVVGDARYVGLGESIHTSGGFYDAKRRLFRHLVEELGFRAFAIESPWQDADLVADYVASCEGDPESVVRQGLFGVWASDEVVAMVRWMCEWNTAHPEDRVVFFGFDVQQPWSDGAALRDFLLREWPDDSARLSEGFSTCDGATQTMLEYYRARPPLTVARHEACIAGLDAVSAWLESHPTDLADVAAAERDYVRLRVLGLRSWQLQMAHYEGEGPIPDRVRSLEGRDRGMATALRVLHHLRAPTARVAVWAHNTHLAMRQPEVRGYYRGARSMGTFLHEELGAAYVPIALIGYDVSINWPGQGEGPIGEPMAQDSVERALHALGRPYLFVDLVSAGAPRLVAPGENVGMSGEHLVPDAQFGGLFFLDVSPGMRALGW